MANLIDKDVLQNTKKWYNVKKYGLFHQTISLIISQKISFVQSRTIRSEIFKIISPDKEFSRNNLLKIGKDKLISIGIDENKYNVISNIINLKQNDDNKLLWLSEIEKIKGIGPWTIKCIKIMFDIEDDIFLYEDLWIRKRLSELLSCDKTLSPKECNQLSSSWKGYRTLVSKFLWRIKPEGITAIKNNKILKENHFL